MISAWIGIVNNGSAQTTDFITKRYDTKFYDLHLVLCIVLFLPQF